MTRKVFFSFHYEDVKAFRANVVRNNWVTKKGRGTATFYDGSIWEDAKTHGQQALKELIQNGMKNTSATVVLIGADTHERKCVKYEIIHSFCRGNGIIGVHINRIRDRNGCTNKKGMNPLDRLALRVDEAGNRIQFFSLENRHWRSFDLYPTVGNRKSNSVYFPAISRLLWTDDNPLWGQQIRLSTLFPTYCWAGGNGNQNFTDWVEDAVYESRTEITRLPV